MNLQQLHIIREAARRGYNLTDVAKSMNVTQPAVSRHIRELETELGVLLFERYGKRLLGLTQVGRELLSIANRMLNDAHAIRQLATLFTTQENGSLRIASQHVLACHQLPQVIRIFRQSHPHITLALQQGSEQELYRQLQEDKVDLLVTMAPDLDALDESITFIPCTAVPSQILLRQDHPLLLLGGITLTQLAAFPLITFPSHSGYRKQLDTTFQQSGLQPNVLLTTTDVTLIHHYVAQDLGIGIVPGLISGKTPDGLLAIRDASHLFSEARLGVLIKKSRNEKRYVQEFVALCQSELDHFLIEEHYPEHSIERVLPHHALTTQ